MGFWSGFAEVASAVAPVVISMALPGAGVAVSGLIGGAVNLASGLIAGDIDNFGEGALAFGLGLVGGALGGRMGSKALTMLTKAKAPTTPIPGLLDNIRNGYGNALMTNAVDPLAWGRAVGTGLGTYFAHSFGGPLGIKDSPTVGAFMPTISARSVSR